MENVKLSRRELNKLKVIENALDFFIKYGIENSKVSDIAEQAGLTERSAFRYFNTKADLVLETALLFWKRLVKAIQKDCYDHLDQTKTGIEKVEFIINDYANYCFKYKNQMIFIQEAETYLYRYDKANLITNKPPFILKDGEGPLAQAILEGIEDGTIKNDVNIKYMYHNVYDSLLGFMQKISLNESIFDEKEQKIRIELFINSLIQMFRNNK